MKHLKKSVLLVPAGIVFIWASIYVFVYFGGKKIIVDTIKNTTKRNVSLQSCLLTPPFNVQLKKLNIEGLAKFDSIYVSPSVLKLFLGKTLLNEIKFIKPELTFEKKPPEVKESSKISIIPEKTTPYLKENIPRVLFKRITINDGILYFIDKTTKNGGIEITVKNINLKINNVYRAADSIITDFSLSGDIPWEGQKEEGKITAEGWVDVLKKDVNGAVNIEGLDGAYLSPYYSQWMDIQKTHIEKARLKFTIDVKGSHNDLKAACHLELSEMIFKEPGAQELLKKTKKNSHKELNIFQDLNKGKIVFNFTFRPSMDNLKFGWEEIKDFSVRTLAAPALSGNESKK